MSCPHVKRTLHKFPLRVNTWLAHLDEGDTHVECWDTGDMILLYVEGISPAMFPYSDTQTWKEAVQSACEVGKKMSETWSMYKANRDAALEKAKQRGHLIVDDDHAEMHLHICGNCGMDFQCRAIDCQFIVSMVGCPFCKT